MHLNISRYSLLPIVQNKHQTTIQQNINTAEPTKMAITGNALKSKYCISLCKVATNKWYCSLVVSGP